MGRHANNGPDRDHTRSTNSCQDDGVRFVDGDLNGFKSLVCFRGNWIRGWEGRLLFASNNRYKTRAKSFVTGIVEVAGRLVYGPFSPKIRFHWNQCNTI